MPTCRENEERLNRVNEYRIQNWRFNDDRPREDGFRGGPSKGHRPGERLAESIWYNFANRIDAGLERVEFVLAVFVCDCLRFYRVQLLVSVKIDVNRDSG